MDKERNSILIADNEPSYTASLISILSPLYTIHLVSNGRDIINTARELLPDLIIIDVIMSDISGFDVISALKILEETKDIPIVFVTKHSDIKNEEKALSLGAADYIYKPFNESIAKLRIQNQIQIVNQMRKIQHLSMTDALTGIANRRCFNARISQEWPSAIRDKIPLALLMLDIDDFKNINDRYGHLFGDLVLQNIAKILEQCTKRPKDLAARWGGEEFVVLLPNTKIEGAVFVAERIRKAAKKQKHRLAETECTDITVSIGINCLIPRFDLPIYEFIAIADKAMYRAKTLGKNRVCSLKMSTGT